MSPVGSRTRFLRPCVQQTASSSEPSGVALLDHCIHFGLWTFMSQSKWLQCNPLKSEKARSPSVGLKPTHCTLWPAIIYSEHHRYRIRRCHMPTPIIYLRIAAVNDRVFKPSHTNEATTLWSKQNPLRQSSFNMKWYIEQRPASEKSESIDESSDGIPPPPRKAPRVALAKTCDSSLPVANLLADVKKKGVSKLSILSGPTGIPMVSWGPVFLQELRLRWTQAL